MQPTKLVRAPLTIVGIVSNVVALILVCVVLCSVPQWPTIEQMAYLIREVAKTRRVSPDDLVVLLGKGEYERFPIGTPTLLGQWDVKTDSEKEWHDLRYILTISPDNIPGPYEVMLTVTHTYRNGPQYIYGNMLRTVMSGQLIPFKPYAISQTKRLAFNDPQMNIIANHHSRD